jgi:hypothetical protein
MRILSYKTCRVCDNPQLDFSGYLGDLPQINRCTKNSSQALHLKKLPINLYFCEHCYHPIYTIDTTARCSDR